MWSYIVKRMLLMIPTLFGILLITFVITQFVPGGPVEQMVAQLQGRDAGTGEGAASAGSGYRGRQGVDAKRIEEIRKLYGFDKPPQERFFHMKDSEVVESGPIDRVLNDSQSEYTRKLIAAGYA